MAVVAQPDITTSDEAIGSLRELVRERWEESDEINAAALVAEFRETHGADVAFLTAFFDEYLYSVVDNIIETLAKDSRQRFVRTASGFVSREKLEENTRTRLAHVFEANGSGTYRSFLTLRKQDLLELNARDQKVVNTRRQWISFRRDLARRMDSKRVVGEVFSTNDLEAAWRKAFAPTTQPQSAHINAFHSE